MHRHEGSDHLLWLSSRCAHKPNTESLAEHWVGTSEARGKELGEGDPVLEGQAGHSASKRALLELLRFVAQAPSRETNPVHLGGTARNVFL